MFIAPDAAEDDIVFLPALERIDTGYFDFLVQILLQRSVELHVVHDIGSLALIRRDDANLFWFHTRFEEFCNYLLDIRGFRPTPIP